jgi:hypothetical protein
MRAGFEDDDDDVPVKAKAVLGPDADEDEEEVEEDDISPMDGLDAAADAEEDDEEDRMVCSAYCTQHAAGFGAFSRDLVIKEYNIPPVLMLTTAITQIV